MDTPYGQAPVPKYYALKMQLLEQINLHEYREGDAFPSDRELIERYGLSRITVRRAVDELVKEGYLYRVQGKGTFVKGNNLVQNLVSITSCTQDVVRCGMTPGRKVISAKIINADDRLAGFLQLDLGEKVFRLERVLRADDQPLNHTITYLPYKLFPGLEEHDFSQESLYATLRERYDTTILSATRTVEAAPARDKTADYLEVSPGTPLLLFAAVTMGEIEGKRLPIEYFDCWYRCDKFKFYIDQENTIPSSNAKKRAGKGGSLIA
ncbi:MAG: GntR family transcriptional regulator [Atopobiaceae bacterium]